MGLCHFTLLENKQVIVLAISKGFLQRREQDNDVYVMLPTPFFVVDYVVFFVVYVV